MGPGEGAQEHSCLSRCKAGDGAAAYSTQKPTEASALRRRVNQMRRTPQQVQGHNCYSPGTWPQWTRASRPGENTWGSPAPTPADPQSGDMRATLVTARSASSHDCERARQSTSSGNAPEREDRAASCHRESLSPACAAPPIRTGAKKQLWGQYSNNQTADEPLPGQWQSQSKGRPHSTSRAGCGHNTSQTPEQGGNSTSPWATSSTGKQTAEAKGTVIL